MPLSRGQRLLRLREQKGVDQKDVAAAIGVSRPYISHLERDAKGRNLDHIRMTLERAAQYFGVVPEYLLVDTPQEYIRAWATKSMVVPESSIVQRLRMVLDELRLRWDDEFNEQWLSDSLGSSLDLICGYLTDEVTVAPSVVEQISVLTGAPVAWLIGRDSERTPDPSLAFERVFSKAVASGMTPDDLEILIDAWSAGRNAKRPPG